jgi:hypothetical protein
VTGTEPASTLERLEDQIAWYDAKSAHHQRWYKYVKVTQIVAAAAIPVLAIVRLNHLVTGALGALIVVLEGFQGLYQFQSNWIAYRSTCEDLKHEKFLHLARAGPYASASDPGVLLAERVESLVSREHAKWVASQEKAEAKTPQTPK